MATSLVPSDPAQFRRNHFNTIRLAMALLVVWSHSFALALGTEAGEPISRLLGGHLNAGSVAVRVFFVVSGLLIARSFEASRSLGSYFRKRVLRIHPGYLVAVAICTFVVVPAYSAGPPPRFDAAMAAEWLWQNALLRAYIPVGAVFPDNPGHAVNGALWSISFEFWCYIGVAALGLGGLLRRPALLVAILIAIMLTRTGLDLTGRKPGLGIIGEIIGWPYLWTAMAPCFLVGVVLSKLGQRIPRSRSLLLAWLAAVIAAAHLFGASPLVFDLIFVPALGYAVMYLAFAPSRLPDLAVHGDFSYGTYLYGFPVQQMLLASFALPFPLYVLASLVCSLGAGMLSWSLVERHFVRLAPQLRPIPA